MKTLKFTDSPFRSQINAGILYLRDNTLLDGIQKKWWEEAYGAAETECEVGSVRVPYFFVLVHFLP